MDMKTMKELYKKPNNVSEKTHYTSVKLKNPYLVNERMKASLPKN